MIKLTPHPHCLLTLHSGEIYSRQQSVSPPSPWLLPAGGCCYVPALCSPAAQLWTNPC